MKNLRNNLFYVGIIGGFSLFIYWLITLGQHLETGRNVVKADGNKSHWAEFTDGLTHNLGHPLALLLGQVVVIIVMARVLGWFFRRLGQPSVIGEIIAGIVLGPSLLGLFFPDLASALFPAKSLGNLQFLSQIGLILFMFVIGLELDLKILRHSAHDAVVVSHASIIVPFTLGVGLAYFLYPHYAPEHIPFTSFGLFLGIAMSITAFPVLARIVQERGMHKTTLGTIVLTCAAADDVTAWCILAAVIAIVKAGSSASALYIVALAALYAWVMIKMVRPFLARIGDLHSSRENLSKPIVAIFFLVLIGSAYLAEVIGIHALFGAFMAGAIMPENARFRSVFIEKVEDVSLVLLLPLFFVFTGLRTQIGLLNDGQLWLVTGLIVVTAVVGKFLGSALAARFVNHSWQDSLIIGALMNTRGLMELVVLNIGYDLGVLSPQVFAMMVIMALVTTFMTGPAIDLINWHFKSASVNVAAPLGKVQQWRILVSFAHPERGKALLRLAHALAGHQNTEGVVTILHLSPSNELNHYNVEEYEQESFEPILQEAKALNRPVTTLFKPSTDIGTDITEVANRGAYSLLLVGIGQSMFVGSWLGRVLGFTTRLFNPDRLFNQIMRKESPYSTAHFDERTKQILTKSQIPVGILIDKGLGRVEQMVVLLFDERDVFLTAYTNLLAQNAHAEHHVITFFEEKITPQYQGRRVTEKDATTAFWKKQDLVVVSTDGWARLLDAPNQWLLHLPSVLIVANNNK